MLGLHIDSDIQEGLFCFEVFINIFHIFLFESKNMFLHKCTDTFELNLK